MEEDIAVIGMSLNFPGSRNKHEFWDNLLNSRFDVKPFPEDRHKIDSAFSDGVLGCFLDDIKNFDADFFDLSEEEAQYMDPQQKILLSLCYELFEDSQLINAIKREKNIGVYIGASENLYLGSIIDKTLREKSFSDVPKHTLTGNIVNLLASRISHHFDLHGPALVFDSACSSSFSALNYAVQDLERGIIEYAIVGGVNIYHNSYIPFLCKQAGIVSPSGKCLAFSSKADGTLPGEGAGLVMLTRANLDKCKKHRIYSLIKGVGLNNDGRTLGIMSPNPRAQFALIKTVYEQSGIDPSTIQYIEAHGTGTLIGDPIEVHSLNKYFQTSSKEKQFCGIGSVKSNIGHLLSASGIAGLLKSILSLWHKIQVPTLHLETVNSKIKFSNTCFYPVLEVTKWEKDNDTPRRAGINNFGIGGTNGHVILEEYISDDSLISPYIPPVLLIPYSTKDTHLLNKLRNEIINTLTNKNIEEKFNISLTQILCRDHFNNRGIFFCESNNNNSIRELTNSKEKIKKKVHIHLGSNLLLKPGFASELYQNSSLYREEADTFFSGLKHSFFHNINIKEVLFSNSIISESNAESALKKGWVIEIGNFIIMNITIIFLNKIGIRINSFSGEGVGLLTALVFASKISFDDAIDILLLHTEQIRLQKDINYPNYKILQEKNRVGFVSNIINSSDSVLDRNTIEKIFNSESTLDSIKDVIPDNTKILYLGIESIVASNFKNEKKNLSCISFDNSFTKDMIKTIGKLYISGAKIDWYKIYRDYNYKYIDLPLCKSKKKKYWLE